MKRLIFILFACTAFSVVAQKKVLIYTHNGKGYVHENIAASVEALKKICRENGYEATATDDPSVFTKEKLAGVQCIIFSNTNNEAFDTEDQKQAFVSYIRSGGSFVGIHSASGSERQWPWFWAMLGGKFVRHPKFQPFTIKIIDPKHPATGFLGNTWQWEDECYFTNQLNPDIHVLLAADLTTIQDEKKVEYPGETFGNYFPLSWCHEFDGGRQFYTALGHDPKFYQDPTFLKHLLGGIKWAMNDR
ncbi:MAG TPA: ThuA domain-containing protein [Cyclobacteriaceae bacterium]|nr:ThuA domain-containing protein [Cyclobacteriaceae bacterium]